jgi:hypothetical protein
LGGESRFEVPRTILLSDWFAEIQQPYFSKFRLIPFSEYRFEVPRTILLTDWYQPVTQSHQKRRVQNDGGETRTEVVSTEIVTLDKWYNQTSQPFFNRKTNSNFGEYRFEVPRDVQVTDWFQPLSEPVRIKVKPIEGGDTRVEVVVVVPEDITVDKWYQPTQQPYFVRYFLNDGWFSFDFTIEQPPPPIPIQDVDGVRRVHNKNYEDEEKERQRIKNILNDDEIIRAILLSWLKHLN